MKQSRRYVVAVAAASVALGLGARVDAQAPQVRVRAEAPVRPVRIVRQVKPAIPAQTRQNRQFRAEQVDRETQTLTLGASGVLELNNLVGDISVSAGGGRDVRLEIVRTSRGRTEADAKLGLDRVRVTVDRRGERAVVTAVYPQNELRQRQQPQAYSVSVSYTVAAPPGTRVAVNSTSGDVVVQGIKGDVSALVTSGDITITGAAQVSTARAISGDVILRDCAGDGGVSAGTMSGTVLFERVKARRIDVDVTGGDIILRDVSAGSAQLKTLSGDVEFTGAFARGGRYEMQTHSGDVQLTVGSGAGFELQARTFSGSISVPQADFDLRNVSTARRSLRGTIGDGSATVTITTFSGDVRLLRK